ncbi:MAG: hypothetical protein IT373_27175 [Polyangiaceae bacterium]|nr:hypothetical protein [Polyangiaceae bacterium]
MPPQPNGTPCDDANVCTTGDQCQAGSCAAGAPVVCTASDLCHAPGVCDPVTGCSDPPVPDGSVLCADGDPCTSFDACVAGACQGEPNLCGCEPGTDCDPSAYAYDASWDCGSWCYADVAHGPFDDFALGTLTDGVTGTGDFVADCSGDPQCNGVWSGFRYRDVEVVFRFPSTRTFTKLTVGINNAQAGGIGAPPRMEVAFSTGGKSFGSAAVFDGPSGPAAKVPVGTRGNFVADIQGHEGLAVRVRLQNNPNEWTFIDEVSFADPCTTGGTCDQYGLCGFVPVPDGTPCGGGDFCHAGVCSQCSLQGLDDCDGTCLDVSSNDVLNCGACGNACVGAYFGTEWRGDSCIDGNCSGCATQMETICGQYGCFDYPLIDCGDGVCHSQSTFGTDVENCGWVGAGYAACGNACDPGDECFGQLGCTTCYQTGLGVTQTFWGDPVNGASLVYCQGAGRCVELETGRYALMGGDTLFDGQGQYGCGSCNTFCPAGQTCIDGVCGTCGGNYHVCGGVCVSAYDDNHCGFDWQAGSCTNVCGPGNRCHGATGCSSCGSLGMIDCGDPYGTPSCVDPQTDLGNCGGCGQVCNGTCNAGVCWECDGDAQCAAGTYCDGGTHLCAPLKGAGTLCARDGECALGYVVVPGVPLNVNPTQGLCRVDPFDNQTRCVQCESGGPLGLTNPCPGGQFCHDIGSGTDGDPLTTSLYDSFCFPQRKIMSSCEFAEQCESGLCGERIDEACTVQGYCGNRCWPCNISDWVNQLGTNGRPSDHCDIGHPGYACRAYNYDYEWGVTGNSPPATFPPDASGCGLRKSYDEACNVYDSSLQCASGLCAGPLLFSACDCTSDSHCPQGRHCSGGACVDCTNDSHCSGRGVLHLCVAGGCI